MKHLFVVLLLICALTQVVKCQFDEYFDYDFSDPDYDDSSEETTPASTRRPTPAQRPTRRSTPRPTGRPRPVPTMPTPTLPSTLAPTERPRNPGVDGNGQLIGCRCIATQETNRVCGTDGNSYGNMAKLKCAQKCGHPVEVKYLGRCTKPQN